LEHKAYWAIKTLNFDLKEAGEKRLLQLCELDELRLEAYKNSLFLSFSLSKTSINILPSFFNSSFSHPNFIKIHQISSYFLTSFINLPKFLP